MAIPNSVFVVLADRDPKKRLCKDVGSLGFQFTEQTHESATGGLRANTWSPYIQHKAARYSSLRSYHLRAGSVNIST